LKGVASVYTGWQHLRRSGMLASVTRRFGAGI